NPVKNTIHFSVLLLKDDHFKVQIYDVAGKLVYKADYAGSQVEDVIHIPNLQHGMYLFRLISGNSSKTEKFIHY
ncbi:MAG TPA: T9SS type A sorting domain-containing protein, partial [Bacteroidia bacterium]|nr:T9SS type A sorting domain-containing protein [Bacteroidia bacterium]